MMNPVPSNLRINNPCPTRLSRLKKDGDKYFCDGCQKFVVDFREKTDEEIINLLKKGQCGIFTNKQLPAQQKMNFPRQMIFYVLTILSYFGLSVSPLKAQTFHKDRDSKDTLSVDIAPRTAKKTNNLTNIFHQKKEAPKKRKKALFRRKKKTIKYRVIGCPDF